MLILHFLKTSVKLFYFGTVLSADKRAKIFLLLIFMTAYHLKILWSIAVTICLSTPALGSFLQPFQLADSTDIE